MANRAYVSLGSNIRPEEHLPRAVQELHRCGQIIAVSSVWQSPAIGDSDQPDYCNAAVVVETGLTASELVGPDGVLRQIEARLGRVRIAGNKNAARTIDLDLSLFNRDFGQVGHKVLPDPDICERACVAVPLSELPGAALPAAAGRRHDLPTLQQIAAELLQAQPLAARPDIDRAIAAVWKVS